jgi:hypothetical protein
MTLPTSGEVPCLAPRSGSVPSVAQGSAHRGLCFFIPEKGKTRWRSTGAFPREFYLVTRGDFGVSCEWKKTDKEHIQESGLPVTLPDAYFFQLNNGKKPTIAASFQVGSIPSIRTQFL